MRHQFPMQEEDNEISLWINRLLVQPESSMEVIWQNYYGQLVEHARKKLGSMPRRHLDEEDVATDALHSLFQGVQAGRFPDLNDRNDLWKILLTITARKAGKAIRANLTQKRGGGGVRGESIFAKPNDTQRAGIGNVLDSSPTPEFASDVVRQCEELLGALDDDILRDIAILKLEGFANEEIATRLDCALRSVERKLSRIRTLWSSSGEDED